MDTIKVTKQATQDYVKKQLASNKVWAEAALLKIFEFQTRDEQNMETTRDRNNVGFTGIDGEILSSFAKQLLSRGYLSPKQMAIVYKKMPKYWSQIVRVSNTEKLHNQVAKSLML